MSWKLKKYYSFFVSVFFVFKLNMSSEKTLIYKISNAVLPREEQNANNR